MPSRLAAQGYGGWQLPRPVSLARVSLWLLQMGIFDKSYASDVAGGPNDHAYPAPDLFEVETPCGHYQGVADQVVMSGLWTAISWVTNPPSEKPSRSICVRPRALTKAQHALRCLRPYWTAPRPSSQRLHC